jgi:hypothetical protein
MSLSPNNSRNGFIQSPQEIDIERNFFLSVGEIKLPYTKLDKEIPEVKELSSWVRIQNDLEKAKRALLRILEINNSVDLTNSPILSDSSDPQSIEQEALFISAIVTYGKCFNEGKGRVVRLKHTQVLRGTHETQVAVHKEMIRIRNKYIAHGDLSQHEQVSVRVALSPNLENKGVMTSYYAKTLTAGLSTDDTNKYIHVIEIYEKFVEENVDKCLKMIRHVAGSLDIDDLYKDAVFPA